LDPDYNFQNVRVKIAKTVIISSLPIIISRLSTILLSSGIFAKLPVGPTLPSPGPIAAIHDATALEAVTGSTPVKTTIIDTIRKRNMYKTTNERTYIFVFSVIIFQINLIKETDFGWLSLMNTFLIFFRTIRCLAILIPPLVDPVLPPENMIRNINRTDDNGQRI